MKTTGVKTGRFQTKKPNKSAKPQVKGRSCNDCGTDLTGYKPDRKLCGWCRFSPYNYEMGNR